MLEKVKITDKVEQKLSTGTRVREERSMMIYLNKNSIYGVKGPPGG